MILKAYFYFYCKNWWNTVELLYFYTNNIHLLCLLTKLFVPPFPANNFCKCATLIFLQQHIEKIGIAAPVKIPSGGEGVVVNLENQPSYSQFLYFKVNCQFFLINYSIEVESPKKTQLIKELFFIFLNYIWNFGLYIVESVNIWENLNDCLLLTVYVSIQCHIYSFTQHQILIHTV